jgi:hypothetical protein
MQHLKQHGMCRFEDIGSMMAELDQDWRDKHQKVVDLSEFGKLLMLIGQGILEFRKSMRIASCPSQRFSTVPQQQCLLPDFSWWSRYDCKGIQHSSDEMTRH